MTERQEFYAGTVEEAVDKAAIALGVPASSVEFEVVDEGSTGFLGIGARDARIAVEAVIGASTAEMSREPDVGEEYVETGRESADEGGAPADDGENAVVGEVPADLLLAAHGFMTQLIEAMGLDGTVDAYESDGNVVVEVSTEQAGLFIGQKGETIDAVQYLLGRALYKDRPIVRRIVVDTEGYRQRRVEAIQGMAHRTARRVQREKRTISLPAMSASERRVVHVFLKENPHVTTASEGQGEDRRVVISPL